MSPFTRAEFDILDAEGIFWIDSIVDAGVEFGLIKKKGSKMKKLICLLFAGCLSLTVFAKDKDSTGRINSVVESSGENRTGEDVEILKIHTIQQGKPFAGIVRVGVQMEGKNDKVAWGKAEATVPLGKVRSGSYKGMSANGSVDWTCQIGCKELKRPKIKAYAVEYGYMKSGEFIVLDSEYKKIDSFKELEENNEDSLPLKIAIHYLYYVD